MSSSPNLPAAAVAETVVGDPNTQKITQAVTGPVVRTVGQAPVSELAPAGAGREPSFEDRVTGLLNLIPFSGFERGVSPGHRGHLGGRRSSATGPDRVHPGRGPKTDLGTSPLIVLHAVGVGDRFPAECR